MSLSNYQLIRHLGINPVQPGEQWLAEDRAEAGRKVVVVKLGPEASADPLVVDAFMEATRREAALDHHDIAPISDVGSDDGQFYYCRSWVDGLSVRQLLARLASDGLIIPLQHALFVTRRAARAVAFAHGARDAAGVPAPVIHGSLSGDRVLLSRDGDVVVSGPWAGDRPGRAGDVRALAAILYELIAGVPINSTVRPRLSAIAPEIPVKLDVLLERSLSRRPSRGQEIEDFAAALDEIAAELGEPSSTPALASWLTRALAGKSDIGSRRPVQVIEAIDKTLVRDVIAIEPPRAPRAPRGSYSPPAGYARIPRVLRPRLSRASRRRARKFKRSLLVLAVAALLFAASTTITMALM